MAGLKAFFRNAFRLSFLKAVTANSLEFSIRADTERHSSIQPLRLADSRLGLGTGFFLSHIPAKGNVTLLEEYALLSIVRAHGVRRFFEFGTFQGQTSYLLAKNIPELQVFTIDLPAADVDKTDIPISAGERRYVQKRVIGEKFLGTPEQQRITQLLGDSASFDYGSFRGKMECIFVDGCHDYAYVKSDTVHALEMLSQKGILLWHDYLTYESVTRYLEELGRTMPLYHIQNTSLVALFRE